MAATRGHLAAKARQEYQISILFMNSQHPLVDYATKRLSGSPWLWEDIQDFVFNESKKRPEGKLFKFIGTYKKYADGTYKFEGEISEHGMHPWQHNKI